MVELRQIRKKSVRKARFVYDHRMPKYANFVGTYNEFGVPVAKKFSLEDPAKMLVAFNEVKRQYGLPTDADQIFAHAIDIKGVTNYWFTYIPAGKTVPPKEGEDTKKQKLYGSIR
jgi:hypothetical protein